MDRQVVNSGDSTQGLINQTLALLALRKAELPIGQELALPEVARSDRKFIQALHAYLTTRQPTGQFFAQALKNAQHPQQRLQLRQLLECFKACRAPSAVKCGWSLWIEHPGVFGDPLDLKKTRSLVALLERVARANSSCDVEYDDLTNIHIIATYSRSPNSDLALYQNSLSQAVTPGQLTHYFTRDHASCLTDPYQFDSAIEPPKLSQILPKCVFEVDSNRRLKRGSLAFLLAKERRELTREELAILAALRGFRFLDSPPALAARHQMLEQMLALPDETLVALGELWESWCAANANSFRFIDLVDTLARSRTRDESLASLLKGILTQAASLPDHDQKKYLENAAFVTSNSLSKWGPQIGECLDIFSDPARLANEAYKIEQEAQARVALLTDERIQQLFDNFTTKRSSDGECATFNDLNQALGLVREAIEEQRKICSLSAAGLSAYALTFRSQIEEAQDHWQALAKFLPIACELYARAPLNRNPYDTQLLAVALTLAAAQSDDGSVRGSYSEIPTGEGKSLIIALEAALLAIRGRRVEILTSDEELSARDGEAAQHFFRSWGIKTLYANSQAGSDSSDPQKSSILYSTSAKECGRYLQHLINSSAARDPDAALYDEADYTRFDLRTEVVRIAHEVPCPVSDAVAKRMLIFADHARSPESALDVKAFVRTCPAAQTLPHNLLINFLHSAWVSSFYEAGKHYVLDENKQVVIVDHVHSGYMRQGVQWSYGLFRFVELRAGAKPRPYTETSLSISHAAYQNLARIDIRHCATFGAAPQRAILRQDGLRGFDVPPHRASRMEHKPLSVCWGAEEHKQKLSALLNSRGQRPVLLLNPWIAKADQQLEWLLEQRAANSEATVLQLTTHQRLLSALPGERALKPLESLPEFYERAGQPGAITVATTVATRGKDIKLSDAAIAAGGLILVWTYVPSDLRMRLQGDGRCARQGQPGATHMLVDVESDTFLADRLPLIRRIVNEFGGPQSPLLENVLSFWQRLTDIEAVIQHYALTETETAITGLQNHFLTRFHKVLAKESEENCARFWAKFQEISGDGQFVLLDDLDDQQESRRTRMLLDWISVRRDVELEIRGRSLERIFKRSGPGIIDTARSNDLEALVQGHYELAWEYSFGAPFVESQISELDARQAFMRALYHLEYQRIEQSMQQALLVHPNEMRVITDLARQRLVDLIPV